MSRARDRSGVAVGRLLERDRPDLPGLLWQAGSRSTCRGALSFPAAQQQQQQQQQQQDRERECRRRHRRRDSRSVLWSWGEGEERATAVVTLILAFRPTSQLRGLAVSSAQATPHSSDLLFFPSVASGSSPGGGAASESRRQAIGSQPGRATPASRPVFWARIILTRACRAPPPAQHPAGIGIRALVTCCRSVRRAPTPKHQ